MFTNEVISLRRVSNGGRGWGGGGGAGRGRICRGRICQLSVCYAVAVASEGTPGGCVKVEGHVSRQRSDL